MSIEVSIQNLADAINNLANGLHKSNSFAVPGVLSDKIADEFPESGLFHADRRQADTTASVSIITAEEKAAAERHVLEVTQRAAAQKETKRLAAEDKVQQEAAAIKLAQEAAEKLKSEESKAISGEHIPASEPEWKKGHPEFDATFNTENGTISAPFLLLPRENKMAILTEFGLAKLSECPRSQLAKLEAAIKAASV